MVRAAGIRRRSPLVAKRALDEIARTGWFPTWGENRIRGMIEARPTGVCPAARVGRAHSRLHLRRLRDVVLEPALMDTSRICSRSMARTSGSPRGGRADACLVRCRRCDARTWSKGQDIVDVWFDSGVSWAAVCEGQLVPPGDKVDLYLEGSDRRGWFIPRS